MRTTWQNLVNYAGTIHGHNISNENQNKKTIIIPKLDHTQAVLDEHQLATKRRDQSHQRLAEMCKLQMGILEDQIIEV